MSLERLGTPTVTIVTESFAKHGRLPTKIQKIEKLPMVVINHPLSAQPEK